AVFTSLTTTVKLLVTLRLGVPLSLTFTVMVFVDGPWASVGVQVRTPVAESRLTPAGALTKAKVKTLVGTSASVAVLVTVSVVNSLMVCVPGTVSTGAVFTSLTTTVKLLVTLRLGVPLSLTFTVTVFVDGPCASVGVQVSTPVTESRLTPAGALTKAKVSVLDGRSASVAVLVTVSVVNSLMVCVPGTVNTGAVFTSLTTTVKLLVTLRLGVPLSLTFTVMVFVDGPWASVGVQVSTPVTESRLTPAGGLTKAEVKTLAGTSASGAVWVTVRSVSSLIVCVTGTVSTGAVFTSLTPTMKLLVTLRLGVPLSLTFTVMVFVDGPWASVGVQVRTPVAESRLTPAGALTKAKVKTLVGTSASVAVLVTVKSVNSLMVCV